MPNMPTQYDFKTMKHARCLQFHMPTRSLGRPDWPWDGAGRTGGNGLEAAPAGARPEREQVPLISQPGPLRRRATLARRAAPSTAATSRGHSCSRAVTPSRPCCDPVWPSHGRVEVICDSPTADPSASAVPEATCITCSRFPSPFKLLG